MKLPALALRWLKFHAVGAAGIGVQVAVLAALAGPLRLHYLAATALAVEAAVLHNFFWHERWTWAERTRARPQLRGLLRRLARFHLSNAVVSLLGNLLLMRLLVGQFHLHYLPANLASIAACSLANFLLSELYVFRTSRR